MQTLGKNNSAGGPVRNAYLKYSIPKRLGLFTCVLAAGLILETGGIQANPIRAKFMLAESGLENTERNARDSSGVTLTAQDQKETRSDRRITAAIRRAVIKHKSLSFDAHNAKIITRNGVVTLRGPVENAAEKTKLESIAQKIRGVKQIDNQLETKTP